MKYFVASFVSVAYGIRHMFNLKIRLSEYMRYFKKSINLSLCYVDFLDSISIRNASRAGEAAFLCCAYDVVTDWRKFELEYYLKFRNILLSIVDNGIAKIAINLYKKEKYGLLSDDGLERGEVALEFVTALTGTDSLFKKRTDFAKLGRILQIGDDVLDYEADVMNNELNCLKSDRKREYLRLIVDEINDEELRRLFPRGKILQMVLTKIRNKAERILNEEV